LLREQRGRRPVWLKVDHKTAEMEKPQKLSKDVPAAAVHVGNTRAVFWQRAEKGLSI